MARRYVYVLLQSPVRPSLEMGRVGWSFRPLDGAAMRDAAQRLIGEHDFSSFRAAQCQALSPVKTVQRIAITRHGAYWRFEFQANAFLHHMIRNIMGCLVAVVRVAARRSGWMRCWLHVVAKLPLRPSRPPGFILQVLCMLPTGAFPTRWMRLTSCRVADGADLTRLMVLASRRRAFAANGRSPV